jgi:tetratricopeptide (TPR) repeat protein
MKQRRMNREENSVPCGSKSASLQMSAILPFLIFALLISFPVRSFALDDYEKEKAHAIELCDRNKFAEALPILEKLNSVVPKDLVVIEKLATALVASVSTQSDDASRTKTLLRARSLALQAKELGDESNLVKVLLERIPPDGKINEAKLSERREADEAMKTAESAFARGDFDAAIAVYRRALAADPKLYEAPLFMGDVYYKTRQLDKAGEAYSTAIAIDPNRETAYRYWADVLTKGGHFADARLKLIEALIAEPYGNMVYRGVGQWAQAAGVRPAHPRIDVPRFTREEKAGRNTIDIAVGDQADGSSAWMWYSLSRATWMDGKIFAKAHPNEKGYRHSLPEESAALRAVTEAVANQQKAGQIKSLNQQLATLLKLSQEGLIEAYVLYARADDEIAQDYAEYRAEHREKLRQYLSDYFMPAVK